MPHVENVNLTGHFLIAMPAMANPYFAKSLTLICEHNDDGAMGVVVNRPTDMQLDALFEQVQLKLKDSALASAAVHFGGPVQLERGFVLHDGESGWDSTLSITDDLSVTTSRDVLEAIARGEGPANAIVALGCAGWGAGQLEQELVENSWLTVPADAELLFALPLPMRWQASAGRLGVDQAHKADYSGHA